MRETQHDARAERFHSTLRDGGELALIVETHSLGKRYGRFTALDDCTLEIQRGEVFGLLGPNGAGKTTLLRILLGFLRPTTGQARIAGFDCYRQSLQVHRTTAYLPGDARLYRSLRGRDVLRFFTEMRPDGDMRHSLRLAERLDLDLSRLVAFMSTGMRQKLALAVTLASNTPLLILDEPTSNLDPTVRAEVITLVHEAKLAGRTVIFSSHVLSEVEEACDRVAILRSGRLVHLQALAELHRRHRLRAVLRGELPALPEGLREQTIIRRDEQGGMEIEADDLPPLLGWLGTLALEEVRVEPIGLKAVYERFHSRREVAE